MKRHSTGFIIGIVVSIIVGFGVLAAVWLGLASAQGLGYEPATLQATKTGSNSATLNLSTFPDSMVCHPDAPNPQIGWVTYCPTTAFEVPANSLITVVIKQYDTPTGLYNDFFKTVQGTVGGVAMYNNKPMSQINADDTAHTFTIQSQPDEPNPIFVSVPLLGVPATAPATLATTVTRRPTSSSSSSAQVPQVLTSGTAMFHVEAIANLPMGLAGRWPPPATWLERLPYRVIKGALCLTPISKEALPVASPTPAEPRHLRRAVIIWIVVSVIGIVVWLLVSPILVPATSSSLQLANPHV